MRNHTNVIACWSFVFVSLHVSAALALQIELVSMFAPFTGNNQYADVWGEGDYAYVGSFAGRGVAIIDLSNPSSPSLAAHYNPDAGGQFKDVKVLSGVGYFASDNGGGVHIVDLSDPTNPSLITQITSAQGGYNSIHNVSISGDFLYEADSHTGVVKVFDVSESNSPVFVRDIVAPSGSGFIHDVTAIGNRLYTSGWGGKTNIYDTEGISPTTAPMLLGSIDSGSNSHSSWASLDGNLLVSAREISNGDVRLYDISSPGTPVLLSTINRADLGISATTPHNPIIVGDLLYVAWYQAGLQVIDISDPSNPQLLDNYDTHDSTGTSGYVGNWGVYPFLGPDRILASDLDNGLFVLSLLSGDYNGDGVVDAADYTVWRDSLGATDLAPYELGDGNGDGKVTAADYDVWRSQFGMTNAAAVSSTRSVPEPSAIATLLCLVAAPYVAGPWVSAD